MSHGQHSDPVQHVNDDHAEDLLVAARAFGGHPDATAALAERIDREGIDLVLATPRGPATAHVNFAETDLDTGGLPAAFAELTRRARATLAADSNESDAL
ncbi:MAG: DUF2470 domain-containing protein [Actinomycetota bacterium]|nr:DUF2470 domain-containing protein [Actinomycetota bacterium]